LVGLRAPAPPSIDSVPPVVDPGADWVSASEIAEYQYCARAYWLERVLHVERATPVDSRLAAGEAHHRAHGRRVAWQHWLVRAACLLLVTAAVLMGIHVATADRPPTGRPPSHLPHPPL
jgi:hypothetical protein